MVETQPPASPGDDAESRLMPRLKVIVNGNPYVVEVADLNASPLTVTVNGRRYTVTVEAPAADTDTADPSARRIKAPMPGTIVDIHVKPGDTVSPGQPVCVLEAMKMKSAIRSSREGVIATVEVRAGQSVAHGDALVTFA